MFRSLKLIIISLFLITFCNSVFSLAINDQLTINGLNLNNPLNSTSTLFDSGISATCSVTDISEDGLISCNLQADANVFVVSSSVMNIINDLGSPENNVKLKIEDNNATFFFLENRFLSKEGLTINIKELEIASGKFLQFKRGQSISGQSSDTDNISVIRLISNIEKIKINSNAKFYIFFSHFVEGNSNIVIKNHYYLQSQGKPGYFFDDLATARNNPLYLGSDDIDFSNTNILISDNGTLSIYINNSLGTIPNLPYYFYYSFKLYTLDASENVSLYYYPTQTNCPRDEYKFLTDISVEESGTGTLPDHCDNDILDGDEDFVDCGGSCDVCEDLSDALLLDTDFNISVKTCSGESDNCCATSSEVTKYFSLNLSLNGMIKFKSIENHGILNITSYPDEIITAFRLYDSTTNLDYTHLSKTIFFFENYSGSNYPKILNNYNSNIVFFSTCSDQLNKLPDSYYNVCSFYNYSNNGNLDFNADGITGGLINDKIFNFSRNTCNAIDLSSSTYTSYLNMANEKKVNPVLFGNISQIFPVQNIIPNLSNPKLLSYNNILKRFQYNSDLLLKTTSSQFKIYNQSEINSNYIGNNSIYAIDSNLSYENDLIRLIYPYKLYK